MRTRSLTLVCLVALALSFGCNDSSPTHSVIESTLVVSDQSIGPADRVVIDQAGIDGFGWVSVHSADGTLLGRSSVVGERNHLTVFLNRFVTDGDLLVATLRYNKGLRTVFEYPSPDIAVLDAQGAELSVTFTVTVPDYRAPSIEVLDQELSPDSANVVSILFINSYGPGVVVVRETNIGGVILASTALPNRATHALQVELSREVVGSETLHVALYSDRGVVGVFEPQTDPPQVGAGKEVVQDTFVATVLAPVDPSLRVSDQVVEPPDQVVVEEAVAAAAGFVVLYEDDGGAPGSSLGSTVVARDTNLEVVIHSNRALTDGETLHAALHVDEGVLGTFELGIDPVAVDFAGHDVIREFEVTLPAQPVPALTILDQTVSLLDALLVSEVLSVGPGFVVIQEDDGAGAPGMVIGSLAVPDGVSADVAVSIGREVADGETLHGALYVDREPVGFFDDTIDLPALDDTGSEVRTSFIVTIPAQPVATLVINDQTLTAADTLTIAWVLSVGPGFVVLREDDGAGAPGQVIGTLAVADGGATDLSLTLTRDALDGETLYGMLHVDSAPIGVFDPAADLPAVDGSGAVVQSTFVVSVATTVIPTLVVTDQVVTPSNRAIIDLVTSPVDGLVVLFADDGAGAPGLGLGAELVPIGTTTNLPINLGRALLDAEVVHVALFEDLGVVGVFEAGTDPIQLDVGGAEVRVTFVASLPSVATLVAQDQTPNPLSEVWVDTADLPADGWVVIGDAGGTELGFSPLTAGPQGPIAIALNRDVVDSETLTARLHEDLGAVGTWEPATDLPFVDAMSNDVERSFVVSVVIPAITVADQTASPANTVTIAEVVSPGLGWARLYDDASGNPGAALGETSLVSGSNPNVSIPLNRDVVHGETLHVLLHVDRGTLGVFGAADVPAVDGAMAVVAATFVVTLEPSVVAVDQTLTLSTIIDVQSVQSTGAGWLVVHEDNAGALGPELGQWAVPDGASLNLAIELTRRLLDGETVHIALYEDLGVLGSWEPGIDLQATDVNSTPVQSSLVATVPIGTPDVRLVVDNNGSSSYTFSSSVPSTVAVVGPEPENQTLTLTAGWRYEFVVTNGTSHPLELLQGATVQLSEAAGIVGALESDVDVSWVDDGAGTIAFTVAPILASALDGYHCQVHPMSMTGAIVVN